MSRPLRIEYAGAWYHVMNRGAGRATILPSDALRSVFLDLIGEIHAVHGIECHAYCLMGNHYHLLLRTPRPNLSRAMQYLDGVYAQRHHREVRTDGPLFRGRYKALLVERDAYLLRVGRYIHRNPLEAALCHRPSDYPWSSYSALIGRVESPRWLHRREMLASFGSSVAYRAFVEDGTDEELGRFYSRERLPPVLGSDEFVESCRQRLPDEIDPEISEARVLADPPDIERIIERVADDFTLSAEDVTRPRDRRARTARAVAMMLCRRDGGHRLGRIAGRFEVARASTVASAITRLECRLDGDEGLRETVRALRRGLRQNA